MCAKAHWLRSKATLFGSFWGFDIRGNGMNSASALCRISSLLALPVHRNQVACHAIHDVFYKTAFLLLSMF